MPSVVERVDSNIQWINRYSLDNATGFGGTYPMDSDYSIGLHDPTFEQLGPDSCPSGVRFKI